MNDQEPPIEWAPRVPQALIRRLYETDARGLYDNELLDEVGWRLYARCDSFCGAVEAANGRARCGRCGGVVAHHREPDEVLRCACGWETTWRAYFATFQHKQLSGAETVLALFREYMEAFPAARRPQAKMILIDQLIHGFHWNLRHDEPTRTTGVNLIEGRYHEVVEFLDSLTYGEGSTPGLRDTRHTWRERINHTAEAWGDPRLRRAPE
ncbi:MAG: hypothetical protein FJZ90_10620 [Chloroflexi bacterium]|nr:hypothetical protein [Chloroflexota bacterium]